MRSLRLLFAALVSCAIFNVPAPAYAAQSYDNCTGFIDSLPAAISTQGTWCLRNNLSTAMASGAAISILTNNVTLDCNDFKIGGLGAGSGSFAMGIQAAGRLNATIRQCNVRGFYIGVALEGGGGGHLIEDNRIDQSLYTGIYVSGDNNRVQRNFVYDTGGQTGGVVSVGISASADIIDNTVAGVYTAGPTSSVIGIDVSADGYEARGNHVRGLMPGEGSAAGMQANAFDVTFNDNRVSSQTSVNGVGIYASYGFCMNNTVSNYSTAYSFCGQSDGNLSTP